MRSAQQALQMDCRDRDTRVWCSCDARLGGVAGHARDRVAPADTPCCGRRALPADAFVFYLGSLWLLSALYAEYVEAPVASAMPTAWRESVKFLRGLTKRSATLKEK